MSAQIWIVRHGETEWSKAGRHTSTTDLPLTDEGERVARLLRDALAHVTFTQVLVSPRLRARRTAELAGFDDVVVDPDLAEWDYGDYEGVTTPTIRETDPGWSVWTHATPGGETPEQVGERLDRVVERARAVPGRTLAFAHGHSLRVLAARWLDRPVADGRIFDLDTATVSVLGDDRGNPVVSHWNVPAAAGPILGQH